MKERTTKRRAPNPVEEILALIFKIERLAGTVQSNDRALIKSKAMELRDTLLKATKGQERRKADRRNG